MKSFMIVSLLLSFSATAQVFNGKPTCEIKSQTSLLSGGGMKVFRTITEEECFQLGEDAFNSPGTSGTRIINPLNNTVTDRTYQVMNTKVKAIYYSAEGKKSKTFKRDKVKKVLLSETVTKVESGFRCWTKDECVVVQD